jgi:2-polyprenyl-6-methoxyphenol hydroxylase-like FAD-dependent oxidoreductase
MFKEGVQVSELPLHVVIIGAGLGGACLAHGLKWAGVSVAVYGEKAAGSDGFFGFRVAIGAGGNQALRGALPPDLYETFLATCAEPPRHLTIYTEELDELFTADLPAGDGDDATTGTRTASPSTLRRLLLTGIEDIVRSEKDFTHYERRPDGRITVHFADGTSVVGDVLVGADGPHSKVRRQYLPQADLQDGGFVAAYGQVSLAEAARSLPEPKVLSGISLVAGRHGLSFFVQPMEFKWDRDKEPKSGVSSVDAALLKTWPGLRLDDTDDHLGWGFLSPSRQFGPGRATTRGAVLLDAVLDATRHWDPLFRTLVRLTDPATAEATRVFTARPIDPWQSTNVTLLGGAIHARVPDPGAGTNATLRAAWRLCQLLVEVAAGKRPLVDAIHEYERQMLRHGFGTVRDYRKVLHRKARMDRPIVGPVIAARNRARLRLVDKVPVLKRRMPGELRWLRAGDTA